MPFYAVYSRLVRQIAGDKRQMDLGGSLKGSVECDEMKKQIKKQLATLGSKMRRGKQLGRQMEMYAEQKILTKELCLYDRIQGAD